MSASWEAELALEARLDHWHVYRTRERRWVAPTGDLDRKAEVPAGWYWAAHWHPDELPVIAETLDELERLVGERTPPGPPRRSILRELLDAAGAGELEQSEGRFFLPGPPP